MRIVLQQIMALVVVPILLVVAWRTWAKDDRSGMPSWRSGVGMTALLVLSLNWCLALVVDGPELLHNQSLPSHIKSLVYVLSFPLDVDAIVLAFALRGAARLEVILAGCILMLCWSGGYY